MDDLFDCAVADLVLGCSTMGVSEEQDGNGPVGPSVQRDEYPKSGIDGFPSKIKRMRTIILKNVDPSECLQYNF